MIFKLEVGLGLTTMGNRCSKNNISNKLSKKKYSVSSYIPQIIQKLPSHLQYNIYDYVGPDSNIKTKFASCLAYFRTGCVGVPSWEITLRYDSIIYVFHIPSYEYYKQKKIEGNVWQYPQDLNNFYYTNKYANNINLFYLAKSEQLYIQEIRNDIFLKPEDTYVIHSEGVFVAPCINISFKHMNDYDILYTLKAVRNDIEDIEKWAEYQRDFLCKKNNDYTYRIVNKWKELGRNVFKPLQ